MCGLKKGGLIKKNVVIIGAGPAGLTCARELLLRSDQFDVTVIERESCVGGLSRTVKHGDNHLDIGGHRFFSKSPEANKMFKDILSVPESDLEGASDDDTFLKRKRISRILFEKYFFTYPLQLSKDLIFHFGLKEVFRIVLSYLWARLSLRGEPKNLEEFFIGRFGRRLYETFFKSYTEKIWGLPCEKIDSSWGAQRIKEISLSALVKEVFSIKRDRPSQHTSLIEQFLYPKWGPGHFWKKVREEVEELGGTVLLERTITRLAFDDNQWLIHASEELWQADYCINTMPIKNLFSCMKLDIPESIAKAALNLEYRDFMTVGIQLSGLKDGMQHQEHVEGRLHLPDNWLYIQDKEVKVGRVQIFNNWSPYMVADKDIPWLGLEYFCEEDDALWSRDDQSLENFAFTELKKLGLVDESIEVLDSKVVRAPKAYPKYTGVYKDFAFIKDYLLSLERFYSVGRNGMHRYNNQDHSMVAAMRTVDHLLGEITDKNIPWVVNTEKEYHEEIRGEH